MPQKYTHIHTYICKFKIPNATFMLPNPKEHKHNKTKNKTEHTHTHKRKKKYNQTKGSVTKPQERIVNMPIKSVINPTQ